MKLPSILKRFATGAALTLVTGVTAVTLLSAPVFAATNVQEEGAIYAGNSSQGIPFSHAGVSAKTGDTVAFEVYYHDLESPDSGLNASNLRVKVNLPDDYATTHNVSVSIKADNSNQVNDSTTVTTTDSTQLQFVPSSVTWKHNTGTNDAPNWVTQTLGDDVVTNPNGAIIEQSEKPCNNFSATLVFRAKLVAQPPVQPQTPVYTCDLFDITAGDDRTVKVSAFATTATNGATFKNAVINWGDNSSAFTGASLVGQTHKYDKDGTYTVTTTAHFTVDGKDVTAGGPSCAKNVTFKTNTPPVVTPPTTTPPTTTTSTTTPTTLVNTGAGSVIGMFAAATAVGAAAYRKVLGRRLSEV